MAGSGAGDAHSPLVIDVEHALARADLALEALIASAKLTPFAPLTTIGKIITGQRSLDHASGDAGLLDAAHLPIDERVIGRARAAAEAGREVYLCSASGEHLVERTASAIRLRLGCHRRHRCEAARGCG